MNNQKLIEKVLQQDELTPNDIPDIALYMDQILTLVDNKLAVNKRKEDDKVLTKTMINNYSKAKLIQPIKGKKYDKQQIIQLLIVNNLKNTLSIAEIKELMQPIYNEKKDVIEDFQQYLNSKKTLNEQLEPLLNSICQNPTDDKEDYLLMFLKLSYLTNTINKVIFKLYDEGLKDSEK